LTVADNIVSMKSESNSLSDNYRRSVNKVLTMFSIFCKNKPFDDATRDDLLCFLDTFRKPESITPFPSPLFAVRMFAARMATFLTLHSGHSISQKPCQELSFTPLVNKLPLTRVCVCKAWLFRHLILFYSSNPIAAVQS